MVYVSLKELITGFFEELKKAIKEYAQKQETQLKTRIKKLLIISITSMVLLTIAISMAGSAALFFLIGSLRYLETTMPAWEAWMIMAATSAIIAAALFVTLFLIIRKQLSTPKNRAETETKTQPTQEKTETQPKQEI
jgi:phosphotransferase system  glucose/maltose/N-acetylglucosamine-specific IIC component